MDTESRPPCQDGCREFDGARAACGDGPTFRSLRSREAQPQATSSLAPFFKPPWILSRGLSCVQSGRGENSPECLTEHAQRAELRSAQLQHNAIAY